MICVPLTPDLVIAAEWEAAYRYPDEKGTFFRSHTGNDRHWLAAVGEMALVQHLVRCGRPVRRPVTFGCGDGGLDITTPIDGAWSSFDVKARPIRTASDTAKMAMLVFGEQKLVADYFAAAFICERDGSVYLPGFVPRANLSARSVDDSYPYPCRVVPLDDLQPFFTK